MIKKISIVLLVLAACGCAQQRYINYATLENSCSFPIQLQISDFSSEREQTPILLTVLPKQKKSIFSYISYGKDLTAIIGEDYSLRASTASGQVHLTRDALLEQLENTARVKENKSTYSWQLNTTSWCAALSTEENN
jgi:hypothetical protein